MNFKIIFGIMIGLVMISVIYILYQPVENEVSFDVTPFLIKSQGKGEPIFVRGASTIFNVYVYSEEKNIEKSTPNNPIYLEQYLYFNPDNSELYEQLSWNNKQQKTVVVVPVFTKTAYGHPGFYDYYTNQCDIRCINSISIQFDLPMAYTSSASAIKVLSLLNYPMITDIEIEKDPNILKKYDKVILLHNEYVTQNEFDAIINHPKVLYLYPNSLHAKIEYNHQNNTISLIRGHGYPDTAIRNGFDWKFDNTEEEYDINCENWEFRKIENGAMLNCYPESRIVKDKELLMAIKEY